jgi:hypothetical protein
VGTVGGTDLVTELERLVGTGLDREAVELRRWQRKMDLVRELKPRLASSTTSRRLAAEGSRSP